MRSVMCHRCGPTQAGQLRPQAGPWWSDLAHGTGGDLNPFFYYQNDSNLSQTSKNHIKFISCSKIMKQVLLFI
jgi:hypothetical protein